MSISTNCQFKSKTINIQNQEGTKGVCLYYDSVLENLVTTNVNPDPSCIPTSQDFVFDYSNKTEFYAGESMTSIHIYFDGLIGSNTTISSQNGTISAISARTSNNFFFNFFCPTITDNLTITSFNSTSTKSKTYVVPITLKTTQAIPLSIASITTQDFQYNSLIVTFNKAVKSIGSITSTQRSAQTITYTCNNTTSVTITSYKTPLYATDSLTFNAVIDTGDNPNIQAVTLNITSLMIGATFTSFIGSDNLISQNAIYTNIEADFSKNIIQNPVTPITVIASTGNQPTNVRIVGGNILFDYTTSSISSSVISFNNLYASDFTFDSGAVETVTYTLSAQPITPQWYANQPVLKSTAYTAVEVNFNKRISACDIITSEGTIINKTFNVRGNVQFDITTTANNITYTFNNIVAEDHGRNTGLILTTGPTITSFANSTLTTNDNKVLIQPASQPFLFTFNKSISK
jgi:hypothetical protein